VLEAGGPDLLAVDAPGAVVLPLGPGADGQRVRTRVRLGDAEGLQAQLAARDPREVALLLLVRAVPQHRAHRVHLGVAGAGVAALVVDLLQDDRRVADAQAAAAVLRRDQGGQPAAFGEGADELLRVRLPGVDLAPVLAREPAAEIRHALADRLLFKSQTKVHGRRV
jgi:hypothetical protein